MRSKSSLANPGSVIRLQQSSSDVRPASHAHCQNIGREGRLQDLEQREDTVPAVPLRVVSHVAGGVDQPVEPGLAWLQIGPVAVVMNQRVQAHERPGTTVAGESRPHEEFSSEQGVSPATRGQPGQRSGHQAHGDGPDVQRPPAPRRDVDVLSFILTPMVHHVLGLGHRDHARELVPVQLMQGSVVPAPDAAKGPAAE